MIETQIIEGLAKPWGELALYHGYALEMLAGNKPYVDFMPEYPPLALWFFKLPMMFGTRYYTLTFYALVAIASILILVLINKMKGNAFIFLAASLSLGGLFWDRFDIFPALFTVVAVYLSHKNYHKLSFFTLGLGFLTKIYPIILLPLLLISAARGGIKTIVFSTLAFLFPILLAIGMILNSGGREGLVYFVEYQGNRGTQIESSHAMPIILRHLRGEGEATVEYNHATYEIK